MRLLIALLAIITTAAQAQPAIPTAVLREEMRIVSNDASVNTNGNHLRAGICGLADKAYRLVDASRCVKWNRAGLDDRDL